jgi:hypothetical protein
MEEVPVVESEAIVDVKNGLTQDWGGPLNIAAAQPQVFGRSHLGSSDGGVAGPTKLPRTVSGAGGQLVVFPDSAFLQVASSTRKRPPSSSEPARVAVRR